MQWAGRTTSKGFMVMVVILLAGTFLAHCVFALGLRETFLFVAVGFGVPYISEGLGLKSGVPFGKYRYTGYLGTLLPFGVPAYVILSWVLLLYSSIIAGYALGNVFPAMHSNFAQTVFVSLLMVAIDGLIDPVAVKVGHWRWEKSGRWFDVPAQNFLGWLVTAVVTVAVYFQFRGGQPSADVNPGWLYYLPVLMFGLLNLHFVGLLKKIGLAKLIPLALTLAGGLMTLYILAVVKGI